MKSLRYALALLAIAAVALVAQETLELNPQGFRTVTLTKDGVTQTAAVTSGEVVTATNILTPAESGRTYFLDSATEFVTTLPPVAIGLRYTFIVKTAPSGASYTIVANGVGSSANDIIIGKAVLSADAVGDSGTADDTISFVDGASVAGDTVTVTSDGTKWYAYGTAIDAADLTFTDAD